jgi:hypothetical protein
MPDHGIVSAAQYITIAFAILKSLNRCAIIGRNFPFSASSSTTLFVGCKRRPVQGTHIVVAVVVLQLEKESFQLRIKLQTTPNYGKEFAGNVWRERSLLLRASS